MTVQNPPPERPIITVSLTYDDVDAATSWLCRVFGFVEDAPARVTHDGQVLHTRR